MAKAVLSPAPVSSPPVTRGLGKAGTHSTLLKHTDTPHWREAHHTVQAAIHHGEHCSSLKAEHYC